MLAYRNRAKACQNSEPKRAHHMTKPRPFEEQPTPLTKTEKLATSNFQFPNFNPLKWKDSLTFFELF